MVVKVLPTTASNMHCLMKKNFLTNQPVGKNMIKHVLSVIPYRKPWWVSKTWQPMLKISQKMKEMIFIMMLLNQYIVFFNGKHMFSPQLIGTTHTRTIGWFDTIYHHWFCYKVSGTSVSRINEKLVWKDWEWDACIMRYNERKLNPDQTEEMLHC